MKPTEFLREFNEKDTGEYNDEAGMALSNLETICRSARELEKHIGAEENLPEWCQEKLAVVKGMLTAVTDYMVSQDSLDAKQDDFAFDTDRIAEQLDTMLEGPGYNHGFADPNAPSLKRSRERDSGDDEPAGVFTVVINGRDWKTATSNEAFRMASAVARKHPGKKVQVRWPNGALNSVNEAEGSEQKKPLRTHKSGCGYNYGHDCDCGGTLTHASDCHHNYGHDCDCGVDKLKQNKQQGVAEAGEWTKLPNGNWRNMHTGVQQSTPPKTKKPRRTMGLDASLEQHADDKMKELGHKFKGNYSDEAHPIRDDGNEGRPGKQYYPGMKEVKQRLDPKCWTGKHKEGTKIKGGVRVNNCVPNESVEESNDYDAQLNALLNEFAGGMGAGSVATAPGIGKGPKVGSLFGGSYAPKTPFNKKRKK